MIKWIAVIHDTHATVGHNSDALRSSCEWLAANYAQRNIVAILHTGDFLNDPTSSAQWAKVAAAGFPVAGLPNAWSLGNHDTVMGVTRDHSNADATLPASGMTGLVSSLVPGSISNTYHHIAVGSRTWGVLALEFDPPDAAVTWADGVLAANPTVPTIVITHSYLYFDGNLTDATKAGEQTYVYTGLAGGDNYGQQMWDKSFAARGNVAMVFSGHDIHQQDGVHWGSFGYQATKRAAGAMFPTCHAFLRNFQGHTKDTSGSPYFTLVGIDEAANKLYIRELSPPTMLDRWYDSIYLSNDYALIAP